MRPWWHNYLFTCLGLVASVAATLAWMLTFQPHGGRDWSPYLFPLLGLWGRSGGRESVPAWGWYICLLLYWPVVGGVVDLARLILSRIRIIKLG
jgi:hypothetical protein